MPTTLLLFTLAALALCVVASGCRSAGGEHPGFPAPPHGIPAERKRMTESPTGLERPLLVIGGWRTPRLIGALLARDLRTLAGADPDRTAAMGVMTCNTMEAAAARAVRLVEERWPSEDPEHTAEVDVVGISMGGLVARAAAIADPRNARKQLRIRRLFTLGTPHRGAALANRIAIDRLARQMKTGSDFLARLDVALEERPFDLVCYARTRDLMVGATNSAPDGLEPYWLHGPLLLSHSTTWANQLVRIDIARRLRGEAPLAIVSSRPPQD